MIYTRIPCKYFPEKHICVGKKYQIRKVREGVGVTFGWKKKVWPVVSHFCPNTPMLSNHSQNTILPSMELPTGHCQEHYQPGTCIITGLFTGESDEVTLSQHTSFLLFAGLLLNHKIVLFKELPEFWVWVVESIDTFGLEWCKIHVESCPYLPIPVESTNPFKPLTHTHGNPYSYSWVWIWVGMSLGQPQDTWGLPMWITNCHHQLCEQISWCIISWNLCDKLSREAEIWCLEVLVTQQHSGWALWWTTLGRDIGIVS